MAAVEPYVVEVILQLARWHCPICTSTGLYLANSMIDGTELARSIIAKRKPLKATTRIMTTMSGTDTDTTRDSSLLATSSTLTTSIMTGTTAAALVSLGTTSGAAQQFNGARMQ